MTTQPDFFGGEHQVQIKDNAILERACNRLLNMVKENPELLDGNTMGEIDAKIFAEAVWQDCFQNLISEEKKDTFIKAMLKAPSEEVLTRARRELLSRDLIRVSSAATKSGERFRARIAGAMK